eukprot:gnl/TRDRNA2_/TRDRNA2_88350_c0_seq1.p1 gnl/TRDRNA2_/TRDRNA2_88350_c0~~gnl/TRDRNA2_/TRDRNA2_88350_c0_seq1.p1  ORF type:complete len:272 (-),score=33.75 gnl/TRDRNA2_/TRDRNA2_88350_c0_seq1:114-857(-)
MESANQADASEVLAATSHACSSQNCENSCNSEEPEDVSAGGHPLAQLGDCLQKAASSAAPRRTRLFLFPKALAVQADVSTMSIPSVCSDVCSTQESLIVSQNDDNHDSTLRQGSTSQPVPRHANATTNGQRRRRLLCWMPDRHWLKFDEQVVFSGPLAKRSRHLKLWRDRWAVLTMHRLFTFQACGDVQKRPTEKVCLSQVTGIALDGTGLLVRMRRDKSHRLRFDQADLAETWAELILWCIQRHAG